MFSPRVAAYAAYCTAIALIELPVLKALVHLSRNDESASHLVLMPLLAIALVVMHRKEIFSGVALRALPARAIAAAGALVLLALAHPLRLMGGSLSTLMAEVVLFWMAGFVVLFGVRPFRAALFPALLLGLTIPIPAAALHAAVELLKRGSAEVVAALFTLTGTTFHRDGFVFSLASVVIEIADECSGIRSSIALVLTALLAGHGSLHSNWRRAVLVAAVLPLVILKNGLRIVTLTLLAMHVDPSFLVGRLHNDGGIVFFLIALAMLAPVLALLRRSESRSPVRPAAVSYPSLKEDYQ